VQPSKKERMGCDPQPSASGVLSMLRQLAFIGCTILEIKMMGKRAFNAKAFFAKLPNMPSRGTGSPEPRMRPQMAFKSWIKGRAHSGGEIFGC